MKSIIWRTTNSFSIRRFLILLFWSIIRRWSFYEVWIDWMRTY